MLQVCSFLWISVCMRRICSVLLSKWNVTDVHSLFIICSWGDDWLFNCKQWWTVKLTTSHCECALIIFVWFHWKEAPHIAWLKCPLFWKFICKAGKLGLTCISRKRLLDNWTDFIYLHQYVIFKDFYQFSIQGKIYWTCKSSGTDCFQLDVNFMNSRRR